MSFVPPTVSLQSPPRRKLPLAGGPSAVGLLGPRKRVIQEVGHLCLSLTNGVILSFVV
jgi:hypothetical protein